jgi:hypothetical protein
MTSRSGSYVYTDDTGSAWSLRLPRAIGNHPLLGFRPQRADEHLPVIRTPVRYSRGGPIRPRHICLYAVTSTRPKGWPQYKSAPVGTFDALSSIPHTVLLPGVSDNQPTAWALTSIRNEGLTLSRIRMTPHACAHRPLNRRRCWRNR